MKALTARALTHWGIEDAKVSFVAGRENQVYRVQSDGGDFALRIKRPGYRSEAELSSELIWLDAMHLAGLSVPRPKPALDGRFLIKTDEVFVDMIGWLEGRSLHNADAEIYQRLGAEMAKLHCACDTWSPPAEFVRCHWDTDGLLGEAPVWGRFWENPSLDRDTRALLERFRVRARAELDAAEGGLDYGLIHADILQENVLIDGPDLRLLDFDDGGFGFRLFDLATTLLRCVDAPNYPELRAALLSGYEAERAIDTEHLNLFLALRAMTYVGWIVPRMSEEGAQERNQRFVARARKQAVQFLNCGFR